MKGKTLRHLSWYALAMLGICVAGLADDIIRHAAVLVPVAIAAVVAAFLAGQRRGRAGVRRAATRRLEDTERARQVAELEELAGRDLATIIASYRIAARNYTLRGKR